MVTIAEIRRGSLDLRDSDDPVAVGICRPEVQVRADHDDELGFVVSLALLAMWGLPTRHADMTPTEARLLATELVRVADAIEGKS